MHSDFFSSVWPATASARPPFEMLFAPPFMAFIAGGHGCGGKLFRGFGEACEGPR